MKLNNRCLLMTLTFLTATVHAQPDCHSLLEFEAKKLRSSEVVDFCERFAGKTMLVVNTASQCGYTSQFTGLEELYQAYLGELAVVGFPSNDFKQEFAEQDKVADVCYVNYGVTFTMLEPSSLMGAEANTLFKALSDKTGKAPSWNFNKYLVSADGKVVKHFPSNIEPMSDQLREEVDLVLAAQ